MRIILLLLLTLTLGLPALGQPLTPAQKKEARAIYEAALAIETQALKLPLKPASEAAFTRLYDEAEALNKRSGPLPATLTEVAVVCMNLKGFVHAQRALALYDPNHVPPPGFTKASPEWLAKDAKNWLAKLQDMRKGSLDTFKSYGI